jgi:hypothetical protein
MQWPFLSIVAAGVAVAACRWLRPYLESQDRPARPDAGLREDTALDHTIGALRGERDPLKRQSLLRRIVTESYRQRRSPAMNKVFHRFAAMHVKEAEQGAAALKAAHDGKLPGIPSFRLLAIALEEEGRFDEALSVCQKAVELDLKDGTTGGFGSRIERLRKKKTKTESSR